MIKNIFVVICGLFGGNTNSKKNIQAHDFKIFIHVRLKVVYLKKRQLVVSEDNSIINQALKIHS